jgi:hypothetical protein
MEKTDNEAHATERLLRVPPRLLLRLAWLSVMGLFVVWLTSTAGPATLLRAEASEELIDDAARRLGIEPEEARLAVRWLAGREAPRDLPGGSERPGHDPENLGARVVACALVTMPKALRLLLIPPLVAWFLRVRLERAREALSFTALRARLQEPVLVYVIELLRARERGHGSFGSGRNRIRQDLSRFVATAALSRDEALGEDLVAVLPTTDLDRLARHERVEGIVRDLREADNAGCTGKELREKLAEALAGKGGEGQNESEGEEPPGIADPELIREACQAIDGARKAAAPLDMDVFLVPRMEGFPLLDQLGRLDEDCPAEFGRFSTACRSCKLGSFCPAKVRALIPRALRNWLLTWRDAIQGLRESLPPELQPLLLPCPEGGRR